MIGIGKVGGRTCAGASRRELLQVGSLGVLGLSLPSVLAAREASAAAAPKREVNVIILWLNGGPSQIDMLDPKPDAPEEIRGAFGTIPTNIPGLRISDRLPLLAKEMDKLSILRASTPIPAHGVGNSLSHTGNRPNPAVVYPSYGSVLAREKPGRNALPTYCLIGPGKPGSRAEYYTGAGYMGATYNPFRPGGDPSAEDYRVRDVSLPKAVSAERLARRQSTLGVVDRFQREQEASSELEAKDRFYQKAYDLVTSPSAKSAFDLQREPAKLRDRYGRTPFGQGCLLARRLIESGVRFTVVTSDGWDTHLNGFNSLEKLLPDYDAAYSALLSDLYQRGMLEDTLVITMGELGRTPKVNSSAGRDHWGEAMQVTMGGGGVKVGATVGRTNALGEHNLDRPVTYPEMAATIYHVLGIPTDTIYNAPDGRPHRLLPDDAQPIHELL